MGFGMIIVEPEMNACTIDEIFSYRMTGKITRVVID